MPNIAPGSFVARMITGIQPPMGQSGNPGDGNRKYFVRIPPNYDPMKRYKVVIAASSCTGGNEGNNSMGDVPRITDASGGAIIIAPVVEPGVWDRDQCYDDKDPNSIEHPFLERFLDQVGTDFCFDKNKVFVQGHSSGGWYSNMVGFTWTTDRIRAISSNGGGLPDDSAERPKLNGKPMAGLWIHPRGDTEQPLAARRAVSRALVTNKCEGAGTNLMDEMVYMRAPSMAWSQGGSNGCSKYMCPDAFPVIFCQPPGGHAPISWHTAAAWSFFNSLP
jgi:poly(3-hydroxybutyrate) depolymerase